MNSTPGRDGRRSARSIVLFTDFGPFGPYLGQVRSALRREAPAAEVIDLVNDAPSRDPRAAAYLLAALVDEMPPDAVCLAVVDPGVGSEECLPVVVEAAGRVFVGPDNGLFNVVCCDRPEARRWEILWRPERLSASFHGRDLFAPVAAAYAVGRAVPVGPRHWEPGELAAWPADWGAVVYVDYYGNIMTGLRGQHASPEGVLIIGDDRVHWARTFAAVRRGAPFWYVNALGLVEIAVNGESAARRYSAVPGAPVSWSGGNGAAPAAAVGASGDRRREED